MPSGTSTMPSAEISPARAVEHRGPEPDQLLGGHRVGDRDEDPGGERRLGVTGGLDVAAGRPARPPARRSLPPAVDEVRLQQLELARLALDAFLGLRRS